MPMILIGVLEPWEGGDEALQFYTPASTIPPLCWGPKPLKTFSFKDLRMPSVRVKENEHFDAALRRFKRACEKAGVMTELRRREFYEKPTQERKRKQAAAVKRHMKKLSRESARRTRLY